MAATSSPPSLLALCRQSIAPYFAQLNHELLVEQLQYNTAIGIPDRVEYFNMELEFRRQDDWRGRDAYIGKYISDSDAAVTTTAAPATTMPLRTYPREVEAQLLRMRARARCYNCKTSRCD